MGPVRAVFILCKGDVGSVRMLKSADLWVMADGGIRGYTIRLMSVCRFHRD